MTINEIENTLQTLEARHPNLTEEMLVTLLTSSGWEEMTIKEAIVLLKGHQNRKNKPPVTSVPVQEKPEELIEGSAKWIDREQAKIKQSTPFPDEKIVFIDSTGAEERELSAFTEDYKKIPVVKGGVVIPKEVKEVTKDTPLQAGLPQFSTEEKKIREPQSLIEPSIQTPIRQTPQVVPPDNLPLRPFESTDHTWPLSKYKDIFHKETSKEPKVVVTPQIRSSPQVMTPPRQNTPPSAPIISEEEHKEEHHHKKIEFKRTGFDGEDEGLIFLTGTSLIIIILLLVYMYSNGRI